MFEFKIVNDYYDFLIGPDTFGQDIVNFISHYFKVRKPEDVEYDLQMALIETTLRNNRQDIGQTFLFGGPPAKGDEILDTYQKIIVSMSGQYKFSPADTDQWYQRDSCYMLIASNEHYKPPLKRPEWYTELGFRGKPKPRVGHLKTDLTDEHFLTFLNEYANQLHEKLSVNDYPHFCVIVKPLSLRGDPGEGYLPIGNLYLLFCTKTMHNERFYAELINGLVLVWLNSNWKKLLDELKGTSEVPQNEFIPNLRKSVLKTFTTKDTNGHTPARYFELFFEKDLRRKDLENAYKDVIEKTFKYFANEYQKKPSPEVIPSPLIQLIKNGGKRALKIEDFEVVLKKILLMRMFSIVAMHIFDLPIPNLHELIEAGYPKNAEKEDETYFQYFHEQRWLTPGSSKGFNKVQEDFRKHMLECLSEYEKKRLYAEIDQIVLTLDKTSTEFRRCRELMDKIAKLVSLT